ncbi:DUF2569 domain-containing protein [Taklimakanibacter deserti]|uniref:DUF2569 domain-containing protein n=1 Tax=Taklimakanibacter deserti TaxID=2267839 RepID=UPI0013C3FC1F
METAAARDEGTEQTPEARPTEGPRGIGGWLILPIIHLVGSIIFTGINLWPVLQNKGSFIDIALNPTYRWMLLPALISTAGGLAILALAGSALVMLYLKRRIFKVLMICFYVLVLVATAFETSLVFAFEEFGETLADQQEMVKELVRSIVAAAIWIPYFLVSKRVKATFIE